VSAGQVPPPTRSNAHRKRLDFYEALRRVEGQFEAKFVVEAGLRLGIRVGEDGGDGPHSFDERADVGFVEQAPRAGSLEVLFCCELGCSKLSEARTDDIGGRAGFDGGDEAVDLLVGVVESSAGGFDARLVGIAGCLRLGEGADGGIDVGGVEDAGDPLVERGDDVVLPQVDGGRVVDLVGERVFGGDPAAVVGPVVVPVALHPCTAGPAAEEPSEDVGVLATVDPPGSPLSAGASELLGAGEGLRVDDGLVGRLGRPDPLVDLVPAELGLVAERDILDIDQGLVTALLVPDLTTRVARVPQDGSHGALRPGEPRPMRVALGVGGARAGHVVAREALGDGVDARTVEVLGVDPFDDRGCGRVGLEVVQSLTVGGLARVGVRAAVGEPVTVGRAAAEEPTLGGLAGHRRAHADLDAVPLALGHAAVERHHQIVRVGAGIDGAADLGHPKLDAEVGENGEGESELVAVERTGGLTYDDRVEGSIGPLEIGEQARGLGSALPRQGPGLADVEVLDDHLALGRDQLAGTGELPGLRGFGVLLVLGADPAVEREALHDVTRLGPRAPLLDNRSRAFRFESARRRGGCASAPSPLLG
jgi:hypothetical protein